MKNVKSATSMPAKGARPQTDTIAASSGDVFADLGLRYSEIDMLKVNIAMAIAATIEERKLTQAQAAKIVGTDQAKMSMLTRGLLKGFAVERLMSYLTLLGRDIEINIPQAARPSGGHIRIRNAA
jgi:predicted XRE-type DNA-binding protein